MSFWNEFVLVTFTEIGVEVAGVPGRVTGSCGQRVGSVGRRPGVPLEGVRRLCSRADVGAVDLELHTRDADVVGGGGGDGDDVVHRRVVRRRGDVDRS